MSFRAPATWGASWLVAHLAVTVALKARFVEAIPSSAWLLVPVVALGVMTLISYCRFLAAAAAVVQREQLFALALGLGAAGIASLGYRLVERLGGPRLDLNDPFWAALLVWGGVSWGLSRRRG